MKLETNRLYLELVTPQRIRELFVSKQKPEIIAIFGYNEKAFERMQTMVENGMETFNQTIQYFVLIDKVSLLSIGECGFHSWNKLHDKADIFYVMHNENFKRKGLMHEAVKAVVAHGFLEMNLHRIQALIDKENTASYNLLRANHFVFEGTKREDYLVNDVYENSECYSLLFNDWKKHSN